MPVSFVLERSIDALLCGSSGWLKIPKGGSVRADWQPVKGCYRVTIDLTLTDELASEADVDQAIATNRTLIRDQLERPPRPRET